MKVKVFLKNKILIAIIAIVFGFPYGMLAQNPSSTNYRLEDSQYDAGGESSSSTNYRSRGALDFGDDVKSTSSNYGASPGFSLAAYPGVPGPPTFTNTAGSWYNQLDFALDSGGNSSDTNYAIAVSTDNFVSITNYIHTDRLNCGRKSGVANLFGMGEWQRSKVNWSSVKHHLYYKD